MSTGISLSIIVPSLGRQAELSELIAEIDRQAEDALGENELIVIDDGTPIPLNIPETHHIKTKLLRHCEPRGAPAARRTGLAAAQGRAVHFHDSDDLIGPRWLVLVEEAFKTNPRLDVLITSRAVQPSSDGDPVLVHPQIAKRLKDDLPLFRHYQRFQNAIGPLGGVTFAKEVIDVKDIIDAPASQDWIMYDAVLARANCADVRHDIYFVFRTHAPDRISSAARRRVKGFVVASKLRFRGRRAQRFASILYCASAGIGIQQAVNVRYPKFARFMCQRLAGNRIFRLTLGMRHQVFRS